MVFCHFSVCVTFCDRIKTITDHWKHFNHRNFCTSLGEKFHNVKTYSTTADDGNFFTGHVFWILIQPLNHL